MATANFTRFNPVHKAQYPQSFKALSWLLEKAKGTGNTRMFEGKIPDLMVSNLTNFITIGYGIDNHSFAMYWNKDGFRHDITVRFDSAETVSRKVYLTEVKTALSLTPR